MSNYKSEIAKSFKNLLQKADEMALEEKKDKILRNYENNTANQSKNLSKIDDGLLKGIRDDVIGEITMDELEKEIIERTLKNCNGNRRKTANILDISERTLYRKLKEYEIN